MMRAPRDSTLPDIVSHGQGYLGGLFTALASFLFDDLAFISADAALTDSDLFFPCAVPTAVAGAITPATLSKQDSITHITFSGRGASGSKVNLHVYGMALDPDVLPPNVSNDFVILSSELSVIDDAVTHLNSALPLAVAIDNSVPIYAARVTVKINDFWLRQVRKGL
jgi:hypothetical protein